MQLLHENAISLHSFLDLYQLDALCKRYTTILRGEEASCMGPFPRVHYCTILVKMCKSKMAPGMRAGSESGRPGFKYQCCHLLAAYPPHLTFFTLTHRIVAKIRKNHLKVL